MEFIDQRLDEYVCAHSSNEPEFLQGLNRKTHLEVLQPRMLSGHFQGRFLSMVSKMIRPIHILEIGTYTGYSALCLAEGLVEGGKLTTIDCNEELEDFVKGQFDASGQGEKINFLMGDAQALIPTLIESFDLVFIDADKENYLMYYNLIFDKIPSGGYILADNVLWSGKVIDEANNNDRDTQALKMFNEAIQNDERVENVLLPLRDGLMLIRKK